jgi:hypothetical protein
MMPAQAQKHVTVNEAFGRLDAAVQMVFSRSTLQAPPVSGPEGQCFLVPVGATGDWKDADGQIATRSNGGWVFLTPAAGWLGWDLESATRLLYDGAAWSPAPVALSPSGAATLSSIIEFDHEIRPGAADSTSVSIPANSQVLAVTGRVKSTVEGSGLTGWQLGVNGADDRYGSGLGLSVNSFVVGISGSPVTYYSDTSLRITPQGGDFVRGIIRLCIHVTLVRAPLSF